ncbi:MAG: hypothetical protein ACRENN_05045 [Candidatus Eiseniibacteriota bacterium]
MLDDPGAACYSCAVLSDSSKDPVSAREIESGKLLAAVAYLPALCFVGLLAAPENRYVGFHARQGFLLFLVEVAAWIFVSVFEGSIGRIPVLGFLVGAIIRFTFGISFLGLTVYGVVKGATGEMARIPLLGDAIEKVPF